VAKCLRCGATSEWIQGKVPDEPVPSEDTIKDLQAALAHMYGEVTMWFEDYNAKATPSLRASMLDAKKTLVRSLAALPRKPPKRAGDNGHG